MITNDPKCVKLYIIRFNYNSYRAKAILLYTAGAVNEKIDVFCQDQQIPKKFNHLYINILRNNLFDSSINSDKAPGSRFHLVKFKAPPSHLKAQDRGQTIALVLG
jgi:hypothetical protein